MSSMNIMPMHKEEADRKHWVVRWLRYNGYLICAICIVVGFAYGAELWAPSICMMFDWPKGLSVPLMTLAGGIVGFSCGLLISLPCWGLSLIIDDLHAMRQYMQGFVAIGHKDD